MIVKRTFLVAVLLAAVSTAGAVAATGSGVQTDAARMTTARSGLIVFTRQLAPKYTLLYVVRPDGTGLRRLPSAPDTIDSDPAWTPDGKRIVFVSVRSGLPDGLYVRGLTGPSARRLTLWPQPAGAFSPAVSRDGKLVAFTRAALDRSSEPELWQVNLDGSKLRRLTYTKGREASPDFDPTAQRRVIYYERDGRIYALGFRKPVARGTQPARTPGLLAFVRNGGVYVTNGGTPVRIATGSTPAWSPDGSRLVYAGADGLYTVKRDGSDRRRLTRALAGLQDLDPAWQPT